MTIERLNTDVQIPQFEVLPEPQRARRVRRYDSSSDRLPFFLGGLMVGMAIMFFAQQMRGILF